MTLQEALEYGKNYLKEKQIADSQLDAWYLLSYVLKENRSYFLMHQMDVLLVEKEEEYKKYLMQRGEHIPLQHITREQEFMGLTFAVNEHVLIPRQDTEVLVEEVLKRLQPGMSVLDLCTGSGCIIISLKHEKPEINAFASDISTHALKMAEQNAQSIGTTVRFLQSDLFHEVREKFDLIVSNPPYIKTDVVKELMVEVKEHEPMLALDGREDGLYFYKSIIKDAKYYLRPQGFLCFEIGYDQGKAVSTLMQEAGFQDIHVIKDLTGLDRVVIGNT